ncbi:peptide chain release factor N(5)-glutamine methyltransferase [bacterium]|nr:peptide chain release factor N(5)-glutamine methyltransferase [bacterium]MBP9811491.1 peptide chain release factor N(5)-glutamine methyltransferase [bacterium]
MGESNWPPNCSHEAARAHFVANLTALGIEQEEARREAELALQFVTKMAAHELLLNAKELLSDLHAAALSEILQQRRQRRPLQYALGEAYFCGLKFAVGPGVLIPRADTETLVAAAAEYIKSKKTVTLLEVGAGSGAIVVTLLKQFPQLVATAFEVSPQAAHFCRVNAICHGVAERLTLIEEDYLEGLAKLAPSNRFELFISNPPYIPIDVAAGLAPEVIGHEPRLALVGGDVDGMGFYRNFAKLLPSLGATAHAALMVEFGDGQASGVRALFEEAGWCDLSLLNDLGGRPRVLTSSGCK